MSEDVELMLLADVRSLESEVGRLANRLAGQTARIAAVNHLLSQNGCDCECDHACEDDHEEDCERCLACRIDDALNGKGEPWRMMEAQAAYEQGLAQRRMMEAQAARDKAQAKAAAYKRDWYEAKSEFGSAMAKMREALRAAEKRAIDAECERDACRGMEQAAEMRAERLFRDRALVDERARKAAQLLIAEVGADGPMNVDEAAEAAVKEINRLKKRLEQLEWGNEMACENTPNPACECSGCETARSRAENGEAGP